MTKWDLIFGDQSKTALVATIDERNIRAAGDSFMPAIYLPVTWEEFVQGGARQDASRRVQAVAFELHAAHNPSLYWIRTGFIPVTMAHVPTLPLPHAIVEELTRLSRDRPDSDITLTLSLAALAQTQGTPTQLGVHWHQPNHAQSLSVPLTKWLPMLVHWGYPATRLVPLQTQLPAPLGQDAKHPAQQTWSAACGHLRSAHEKWTAGRARDAGRDLRDAVQLALRTWATLWYPTEAPVEGTKWFEIAKTIGSGIPGCTISNWTILPKASRDAQRSFAVLQVLRDLNAIANPHHHVGAAPVYTEADVEMLVTATTAILRSLPEFWRQFPTPLQEASGVAVGSNGASQEP